MEDTDLSFNYTNGDGSNVTDPNDLIVKFFEGGNFDPFTEIVVVVVYCILSISGFLFNSAMMIVILMSSKLRNMPFNLLLLNLAFSNILMSVFCMPFTLVILVKKSWAFGAVMCKIIPTIQGVSVCVSSTTVTVIAFDRYITILYSESMCSRPSSSMANSRLKDNRCRVALETIFIWTVGIVFGVPVSYFQDLVGFPDIREDYVRCVEMWPLNIKVAYSISVLIVQCVMPSLALVVTSSLITNRLNRKRAQLTVHSVPLGAHARELPISAEDTHRRNVERNKSVTRILLTVSVTFTVCWLPLHILNFLLDLSVITDPPVQIEVIYLLVAICHAIAMTSAPLNALLYGWYNPNINREVLMWTNNAATRSPRPTTNALGSVGNLTVNGGETECNGDGDGKGGGEGEEGEEGLAEIVNPRPIG